MNRLDVPYGTLDLLILKTLDATGPLHGYRFASRRMDRELDGEARSHLELAERDLVAQGLPPAEARRRARLEFGGIEVVKEAQRDERSWRALDHLAKDAKYGIAGLVRNPAFT